MNDRRTNAAWETWRRQVLERVRFWPDRAGIGAELDAHYTDHVRDLERIGYAPDLAEERALRAMGEAETVGRAMDRAHKPWLGWLWEGSRGAVLLAALLLLVSVAEYGWPSVRTWLCPDTGWDVEYDYPIVGEALLPEPVEMGDYTLRPVNSRYWTEGNEKAFLELMLVAETPKIWLNGPDFADGALEAWDSRGNHYTYGKYPRILTGGRNGHGRSACQIQLYGLEDRPEWVELRHVYTGWTMRIELRYREEGTA